MDPFILHVGIFPNKCTIGEIFVFLYEEKFRWQKLLVMPKLFIHCINIWESSEPWIQELERRIFILSLLYIIVFLNLLFLFKRSDGWLESLGEWTSIFKEEYGNPGCLMTFVLWVKWFYFHIISSYSLNNWLFLDLNSFSLLYQYVVNYYHLCINFSNL